MRPAMPGSRSRPQMHWVGYALFVRERALLPCCTAPARLAPSAVAAVRAHSESLDRTYNHIAEHDPSTRYDPDVSEPRRRSPRQLELLATLMHADRDRELVGRSTVNQLPENPVMVTFDDGYLRATTPRCDLRAVGIRATFFIATGFTNDRGSMVGADRADHGRASSPRRRSITRSRWRSIAATRRSCTAS